MKGTFQAREHRLSRKMGKIDTIVWTGHSLRIIDQVRLPGRTIYRELKTVEEVWEAIRCLRVRGAPALGVAAAYGLYLGLRDCRGKNRGDFLDCVQAVRAYLETSRPTAVNLFASLDRIEKECRRRRFASAGEGKRLVLSEAGRIAREDRLFCERIAEHGFSLVPDTATVLTHCNAGALATAGIGTALGVIRRAYEKGKRITVFADETRPLLQGSRLTAWELRKAGIPVTVLCDNAAGWLLRQRRVDLVVVGADRIAANGDTANKVGTYPLAVLARYHRVPFYVAAPGSTFDLALSGGEDIPIEERAPEEVALLGKTRVMPAGTSVYNPAFDVTPGKLVTAFITERGVINAPFSGGKLRKFFI